MRRVEKYVDVPEAWIAGRKHFGVVRVVKDGSTSGMTDPQAVAPVDVGGIAARLEFPAALQSRPLTVPVAPNAAPFRGRPDHHRVQRVIRGSHDLDEFPWACPRDVWKGCHPARVDRPDTTTIREPGTTDVSASERNEGIASAVHPGRRSCRHRVHLTDGARHPQITTLGSAHPPAVVLDTGQVSWQVRWS